MKTRKTGMRKRGTSPVLLCGWEQTLPGPPRARSKHSKPYQVQTRCQEGECGAGRATYGSEDPRRPRTVRL